MQEECVCCIPSHHEAVTGASTLAHLSVEPHLEKMDRLCALLEGEDSILAMAHPHLPPQHDTAVLPFSQSECLRPSATSLLSYLLHSSAAKTRAGMFRESPLA